MPSTELRGARLSVLILVADPESLSAAIADAEDEFRADRIEPILLGESPLVTNDPRVAQSLLSVLFRLFRLSHDSPPEISLGTNWVPRDP